MRRTILFTRLLIGLSLLLISGLGVTGGYCGELIPFPKSGGGDVYQEKQVNPYFNEFRKKIEPLNSCQQLDSIKSSLREKSRSSRSQSEFEYYQTLLNILSQKMFNMKCTREQGGS
ncbi:hypothetical protein KKI24_02645 [bacterium]|nr:hypothetical protein [bacterium]